MKRFQALKELDTQIEQRSHTRKKVKGSRPPITRFVYSSESEYSERDDKLVKSKRRKDSSSPDDFEKRDSKYSRRNEIEEEQDINATDGNDDECYLCEDGGNILCCDNCFRSFHLKCLKLSGRPENEWICPYCRSLHESVYDQCGQCFGSLKESENYQKITCTKCLKKMHLHCIDTPLSLIIDNPLNKNYVFDPKTVKELKHSFFKQPLEPEEMIKELYLKSALKDYYLVKLKKCSDIHTFWLNQFKVESVSPHLLRVFLKKINEDRTTSEGIDQDKFSDNESLTNVTESFRIEKVLAFKKPISARNKNYDQVEEDLMIKTTNSRTPLYNYKFLVKWEDLEYSQATWEDEFIVLKFKDKIKQYFSNRITSKKLGKKVPIVKPPSLSDPSALPDFVNNLYDYQIKGFKWLTSQYLKKKNAILADEMGLGKTIQTLCFFRFLSEKLGHQGPFLVVAPNSTIYNWQREAQKWCPEYDIVVYLGSAASRKKIMETEFHNGKHGSSRYNLKPKFHLLITTYTFVNIDIDNLKKIQWEVVVVDEAQRLKNKESKLYKLCNKLRTDFKLLLTGTPIQNSIDELINLFKYLIPSDSSLHKEVDDLSIKLAPKAASDPLTGKKTEVNDSEKQNALKKLRSILKEHMLRRTVQDANLNFPELEEKLVKLNLSNMQKHLYKNILLRNYEVLSNAENIISKQSIKSRKGGEGMRVSLINILMHLRLVCDHPDLFYARRREYEENWVNFEEEVVKSSNKLRLLSKMIPKLLEKGHKILIFTQFVLMLDIIGEFFDYNKLDYERLDGTTRNIDRQKIIDSFNNGKSKIFILSTRAGGLGINLTASDTVIFVDSDFNPYQDIQAFCRAYRIGQKNKVMVYRLVSKFTVEEKIIENATKKLMMGEIIMNPIDQSKSDKGIIESILRYGTKELFEQTSEEQEDDEITEEKLEELLKRDQKGSNEISGTMKTSSNGLTDYYLSGFHFTDFSFAPILDSNVSAEETKENKYWETLLGNEHIEYEKKNIEDLGKGKRNKKTATTMNESDDSRDSIDIEIPIEISSTSQDEKGLSNSDSEYGVDDFNFKKKDIFVPSSEEDDEEKERIIESIKALPEHLQEFYNSLSEVYMKVKNFNLEELWNKYKLDEAMRMKFVEFVLKHGTYQKLDELTQRFWIFVEPLTSQFRTPSLREWKSYLKCFYACCLTTEALSPTLGEFFFSNIDPYAIRKRMLGFINLRTKLSYYKGKIGKFKISNKKYTKLVGKKSGMVIEQENKNIWTNSDDYFLLEGINKYGLGEWEKIITDIKLWNHIVPTISQPEQVWKTLFMKIEEYEPSPDQEKHCYE